MHVRIVEELHSPGKLPLEQHRHCWHNDALLLADPVLLQSLADALMPCAMHEGSMAGNWDQSVAALWGTSLPCPACLHSCIQGVVWQACPFAVMLHGASLLGLTALRTQAVRVMRDINDMVFLVGGTPRLAVGEIAIPGEARLARRL